jgi:hypothetical protein
MLFKKFEEFKQKDLEPVKSFFLKDELNPKIWKDFNIDTEIREQLLQVAEDFFTGTDLDVDVQDVVLCGSLCNYNWSEKYSDYDLHILIKYKDVDENLELVEQICDLSKKKWNEEHDVKIKGYEVEVAIQDMIEFKEEIKEAKIGGAYSLLNDRWIKKPELVDFEPNVKLITEKGKTIMMQIDNIEEDADDTPYKQIKPRIDKVWDKIKNLRKKALADEGEFGLGNLIFKLLRRNGYIGKIMKLKTKTYDKQFESINEWYDDTLLRFFYELDGLSKKLDEESYEGWSKFLNYNYDEDKNIIEIEFGASGYSEGFHEDWIIDFSDIEEIVVNRRESHSGPYGDGENKDEMRFLSFEELMQEIKENLS